jgi:hypothetical protein
MAISKKFVLGVSFVIGTVAAVSAVLTTSSMGSNIVLQSPGGAIYAPIPAAALSGVGVTLTPLTTAQVAMVKVTAAQAMTVTNSYTAQESEVGVTESVTEGSFTDVDYKAVDSEGVYEPVVEDVPAYVVTLSGLKIASDFKSSVSNNTEDNFVVNAATGNIILSFTYR